jgi:hypothetical protein
MMRKLILALVCLAAPAAAETVDVKFRGPVDLRQFECTETPKSSFIRRVCYDEKRAYMLIQLNAVWYHYCEIGSSTVSSLLTAESAGRYYNANIKGTGKDGPFDCRTHKVRTY